MPGEIRHKEFRFPVQVVWHAGRRTTARVDGKAPLRIATPPEFRGTDPDIWSPEGRVRGRGGVVSGGDDRRARRT